MGGSRLDFFSASQATQAINDGEMNSEVLILTCKAAVAGRSLRFSQEATKQPLSADTENILFRFEHRIVGQF